VVHKINDKLNSIDAKYGKKDSEMNAHLLGNLLEGYQDVVTEISGNVNKMTKLPKSGSGTSIKTKPMTQ
jgi:hypothetical protein